MCRIMHVSAHTFMLTQQNMHAGVTSFFAKTHATTSAKFNKYSTFIGDVQGGGKVDVSGASPRQHTAR